MSASAQILIVDDEADGRAVLAEVLRSAGFAVAVAADAFKALPLAEELAPDVVLTDLKMPGMDGVELMQKVHERDPECVVVVMTASSAVERAVEAMRLGAADYLTKPLHVERLLLVLAREVERKQLRAEASVMRQQLAVDRGIPSIVGSSAPMQQVLEVILQVAPSRASVIISGESGTGKELVAAALHAHSPRAKGPFVKLHCASLAESLLESELFGHERGAFTGAIGRREGRFSQADHGTLFLDEIAEIPPAIQVKLLRFLQEREFERVGGNQTLKVDVRVIAATNHSLIERVKEGRFREDLYYRLNVVAIQMPPLRARPSDVPALAIHFLERFAAENGKVLAGFSDDALVRLVRYGWPGNVRELANIIERAVVVSRGERIEIADLSTLVVAESNAPGNGAPAIPGASMADVERYTILKTLESTGGSTALAADILGISVRTIQYRMRGYQSE